MDWKEVEAGHDWPGTQGKYLIVEDGWIMDSG